MVLRQFALQALVASSIVACANAASAQVPSNQDLVGTWNITLTSPQGTHPATMTIREDGGQLAGAVTGLPGTTPVAVKTSDSGVMMSFDVNYQGQPIPVVMTGKVSGTEIKGAVDFANGGAAGDFTGTKAGAAAAGVGPSVAGTWAINSDGGGRGASMDLTQEGTVVTGTLSVPEQGLTLSVKGTFENSALDLAVAGDMAGAIKGTLDGASLKGNYDVDGNTGSWAGTRKP